MVAACSPTRRQSSSRSTAARSARKAPLRLWLTGITPAADGEPGIELALGPVEPGLPSRGLAADQGGRARRAVAEEIGAGEARGLRDRVAAPRRHQVDHGRRQSGQPHGLGGDRLALRAPIPQRPPPPAPRPARPECAAPACAPARRRAARQSRRRPVRWPPRCRSASRRRPQSRTAARAARRTGRARAPRRPPSAHGRGGCPS